MTAAVIYQLQASGTLVVVVRGFLSLGVTEQISLLALLVLLVLWAVSLSQQESSSTGTSTSSIPEQMIDYPLKEISHASNEKEMFKCLYPLLKDEIITHLKENSMPDEAVEWCTTMMDYTVPGGKLNRGTTVLSVHRTLCGGSLSTLQVARASVLGWAVEFLQAFFLVADDVMDESKTRRGQPCWYKLENVQMIAINDSFLLESFVFTLLKTHFGKEPCYHRLVALFLDVIQKTEFGQLLDLMPQPVGTKIVNLSHFTLERYQKIVKFKTAFYTFYLPVAIGMITSGVTEKSAYELAEHICCMMGECFQIQDDYLDCFGDPELIGKVGTDIQDNKCSWLVVQALAKANPQQRKVLEVNYGVRDDRKVQKVKALYKELDLPAVFTKYEDDSYAAIQAEFDKVELMPRDVFELLLNKIYKRRK
jgi:farnesyl diphosphate synthase